MDLSSIVSAIKHCIPWILKKFGYKIVKSDDYIDETLEVAFDYTDKSPECIQEKNKGSKFYWSDKYNIEYEKYFEICRNKRRYFRWKGMYLWVKKNIEDNK